MSPRQSPTRAGGSNDKNEKESSVHLNAKVTAREFSNDPPYPSKENPKNEADVQKKSQFLRKRKFQNYEQQNDDDDENRK